jgi:signal peptidase I
LTNPASLPCTSPAFAGLSSDILQHGKSLRFKARGMSMRPLVQDGDTLVVQPVEARQIRAGDVVLCSIQEDCVVVHRVLRRLPEADGFTFLVQGDQAAQPDGWIPQAQVYGRVAAIERAGVPIDMYQPVMRLLGWLAVLRSRRQLGHRRWVLLATQLARRLPVFYRYLE